jgi:simple sugar transport system ATP-binding protein
MTDMALELKSVGKSFGSVIALADVSVKVRKAHVTCILGDNGAGKSTLIKTLSGVHKPSSGVYEVEGEPMSFDSPRDALAKGIATVYQDLATIPLMSVWRNFFLGNEITKGWGPLRRLDVKKMKDISKEQLLEMGIDLRDTGTADWHALRWRAPSRCYRSSDLFRCQGSYS